MTPGALDADVEIVAEADGRGGTRHPTLRGTGALAVRAAGGAARIVGAAAGPLAGDTHRLRLTVGERAVLRVRSVAATVLLPGPDGAGWSVSDVRATVAAGGTLDHAPEQTVAARGCRHRQHARVDVAAGAALRWREELILGRHGEEPGECVLRLDVDHGGAPLLRHELHIGGPARHRSTAVLGNARAVGTLLLAGDAAPRDIARSAQPGAAVTRLAGRGVLVTVIAGDAATLRRTLDEMEQVVSARS